MLKRGNKVFKKTLQNHHFNSYKVGKMIPRGKKIKRVSSGMMYKNNRVPLIANYCEKMMENTHLMPDILNTEKILNS